MTSVGEDASVREREAMEAERDSVALKEAEFMANKIGHEYEAVISGVTNFGIFVELPISVTTASNLKHPNHPQVFR